MATTLQEAESSVVTARRPAEISWDPAMAAKTRKMCEYETDQECICAEGEECWLV